MLVLFQTLPEAQLRDLAPAPAPPPRTESSAHPGLREHRREQPSRPVPAARGGLAGPVSRQAAQITHPPEEGARRQRGTGCLGGGTGRRQRRPPRSAGRHAHPRGCYSHCRFSHIIHPPFLLVFVPLLRLDLQPLGRCGKGNVHLSAPHRPGAASGTAQHGTAPPAEPFRSGPFPLSGRPPSRPGFS